MRGSFTTTKNALTLASPVGEVTLAGPVGEVI